MSLIRLPFIFLVGFSVACQVTSIKNGVNIHCSKRPVGWQQYRKLNPDRYVVAWPKKHQLTVEKNPNFKVLHLKHQDYLVIKAKPQTTIAIAEHGNDLRITQMPSLPKCQIIKRQHKPFTVMIDPGHGGHDPGTISNGVTEKDLVLIFAKELQSALSRQAMPIKAILTRTNDRYLHLRQRTDLAKKHHADIFISIHADGTNNSQARGLSIFTLSQRGASSEAARLLAKKENAHEIKKSSIFVSFRQSQIEEQSKLLADMILSHLIQSVSLHTNHREEAGFAVLKSLDVPSCLIEIGFISNEQDRMLLLKPFYRRYLADLVAIKVSDYFKPKRYQLMTQCHSGNKATITVKKGDTLDKIAKHHRTSMHELKTLNGLKTNTLRIGQKLRLYSGEANA